MEDEKDELYKQSGKAHAEKEFLKKLEETGNPIKSMVDPYSKELSIIEQFDLLGKTYSWLYYQKQRDPVREYQDNLEKRKVKKLWQQHIFYGYRQIYNHLDTNMGYKTSPKRVYRLMKDMGNKAIIPKRCLSKPGKKHKSILVCSVT